MKVSAFIPLSVAFETFGVDYVGHFKCGSCRYVVRSIGGKRYLLCKEYGRRGEHVSETLDFAEGVQAESHYEALEAAAGSLMANGAGIHRVIALDHGKLLN